MTARPPGMIEATLARLFMRSARVLEVENVGPAFCIVTLGGDALRDSSWTPGDKIQLQLGGWVQRTYTPMDWDARAGRTRILVYRHATGGPGQAWARSVRAGDECTVFGPRKSVRLAGPPSPVVLFGDETSLGLAVALRDQLAPPALKLALDMVLEVTSLDETAPVIDRLRLHGARLSVRQPDDAHLDGLKSQLAAALQASPPADLVLTGKAATIQHLGRFLRESGRAVGRRQSKAYWATGKSGMD